MRLFFRAHRNGVALSLIPQASFLLQTATAFNHADVPLDFVLQRFLQVAEGIEVFDFDLGAKFFEATRANADVGVAAE